ncbi:HAMP domain-containing protein [Paraburkholderia sp. Tr-20389]|nr:methyl-accepting chemotaxis protein [Paraburkholderia sp. Tr-20389]MBN3752325.1 HAMP domain-containing protein [Paraburkholderia sp. Tr-20389]
MPPFIQSVKFKIALAFGVCMIVVVAIGIFGVFGVSRLNSIVKESYTGNTVPIGDLSELRAAHLEIRLVFRRIQVFHEPAHTQAGIEAIRVAQERMNKAWTHYYPNGISSAKEREIADGIQSLLPQFASATEASLAALRSGDTSAASAAIDKHAQISNSLSKLIEDDVALNFVQAREFTDVSESTFKSILWLAIGLVSGGVVIAAGAYMYLLRTVTKPLTQAMFVANAIAGGKLGNRIAVEARDEFGQLLHALKKMDLQLSGSVRSIRDGTESVTVAAGQIASGNSDLSSRTEEQAASLEETAASMTQLTQTVRQNSDNARQANILAAAAADEADSGNEAMQGMVRTIEQISSSSVQISDITGVIEGIAFQTNILALNAAVEAARAGEQGRGFAVVASEVRNLAQRSAAAAKEIKDLISSSVALIEGGAQQAVEVGGTVGRLKQTIKHVSDIVGEIMAATDEQSRGIEQVHQAVSQMDQMTQQNAALVEQAAAAAQSLEEQALHLKQSVSVFVLAPQE